VIEVDEDTECNATKQKAGQHGRRVRSGEGHGTEGGDRGAEDRVLGGVHVVGRQESSATAERNTAVEAT